MNKYNAKKIVVDGIKFDSKKEAERYSELKLLERCGAIKDLELQKKYILIPAHYEVIPQCGKNGVVENKRKCIERSCTYKADFVYTENGETVVEDVKGYRGGSAYEIFKIKRKLMFYIHGIKIKEI